MASSQTEFALQELTACWDQGYEALARGDLDRVASLMTLADDHLRALPPASDDSPVESKLRLAATAARGRLEHGMRSGLSAVREELIKVHQGVRALGGYKHLQSGIGHRVERDA